MSTYKSFWDKDFPLWQSNFPLELLVFLLGLKQNLCVTLIKTKFNLFSARLPPPSRGIVIPAYHYWRHQPFSSLHKLLIAQTRGGVERGKKIRPLFKLGDICTVHVEFYSKWFNSGSITLSMRTCFGNNWSKVDWS